MNCLSYVIYFSFAVSYSLRGEKPANAVNVLGNTHLTMDTSRSTISTFPHMMLDLNPHTRSGGHLGPFATSGSGLGPFLSHPLGGSGLGPFALNDPAGSGIFSWLGNLGRRVINSLFVKNTVLPFVKTAGKSLGKHAVASVIENLPTHMEAAKTDGAAGLIHSLKQTVKPVISAAVADAMRPHLLGENGAGQLDVEMQKEQVAHSLPHGAGLFDVLARNSHGRPVTEARIKSIITEALSGIDTEIKQAAALMEKRLIAIKSGQKKNAAELHAIIEISHRNPTVSFITKLFEEQMKALIDIRDVVHKSAATGLLRPETKLPDGGFLSALLPGLIGLLPSILPAIGKIFGFGSGVYEKGVIEQSVPHSSNNLGFHPIFPGFALDPHIETGRAKLDFMSKILPHTSLRVADMGRRDIAGVSNAVLPYKKRRAN